MTTDQTINGVSRELLASFAAYVADSPNAVMRSRAAELRALLDAPAKLDLVECDACPTSGGCVSACMKAPKPASQPQGESVALFSNGFTTLEIGGGKYRIITQYKKRDDAWSDYTALCKAEQPAPVAVVMPDRDSLRDVIAQAIGGDAYDCVRVWSAWGVGTMSEDNFVPVVDQEARLYEIADACLDELNRLNPSL